MRKLAVLLGGLLAVGGSFGARALATHATATVDPGPPPCATVRVAVDGTPVNVDQTQCAPAAAPALPPPTVPALPDPGNLPALPVPQLPTLPTPPPLPVPTLPLPPVGIPPTPLPGTGVSSAAVQSAAVGSLCNYDPARPAPPPVGEQTVTLPDGTTIFGNVNVDPTAQTVTGYLGGTNPMLGTLEGGGTASPAGATGQIDGNNIQTGLNGYVGTNGACIGK
ncbi:MAG: hypothetical protein JWP02_333 [Acidimicrobiales bacterium]|nr:hypothetical protein [Acidimicrobiales bacterium]